MTVEEVSEKIERIETKLNFQALGKPSIRGKQGGGFKTIARLGADQGTTSSQEPVGMYPSKQDCFQNPVGRQKFTVAQPSALKEKEDILTRQSDRL